jgi:hypothetical protein
MTLRTGVDAVEGEDEEDDGLHGEGGRPAREERLVICVCVYEGGFDGGQCVM